jgi:hypothetical protein
MVGQLTHVVRQATFGFERFGWHPEQVALEMVVATRGGLKA